MRRGPAMRRDARSIAPLLAATVLAACSAHGGADRSDVTPSVPLVVAKMGTLVERVTVAGRAGSPAGTTSHLAFAEAGIVAKIDVRVGETIRAGASVAELDRAALAAPLAQARADAGSAAASYAGGAIPDAEERGASAKLAAATERLATLERGGPSALSGRISAQAAARQAALKVDADEATLARERELFAAGVTARKDLDAAQVELASDVADRRAAGAKVALASSDFASAVAQARADVAAARTDEETARSQAGVLAGLSASARARAGAAAVAYENGILSAPEDAVVLAILKHPGEAVDPVTPVAEIGPATAREATLTAGADIAERVRIGDRVTMQLANHAGRTFGGRVTAVVPVVDPATHVATVVVDGVPPSAVPGEAVAATIDIARVAGVIVPAAAIVEDPETGKTVVFVRAAHPKSGDAAFAMRTVAIRTSDAQSVAIGSGLAPGERIAAQGGYTLLAPTGD